MRQVAFAQGSLTPKQIAASMNAVFSNEFATTAHEGSIKLTTPDGHVIEIPVEPTLQQPEVIAMRLARTMALEFRFRDKFVGEAQGSTFLLRGR